LAEQLQRLLQVDNVNAVALREDVLPHLRVPTAGLVPEMDTRFEQVLELGLRHAGLRSPYWGFASTAFVHLAAPRGPQRDVQRCVISIRSLTLRELEPLARSRLTGLLPLDLPRVPGQQPVLTQRAPQIRVELEQRPRDAQTDRPRLARQTAAVHVHQDVEPPLLLRHRQRLLEMLLQR